MKAEISINSSRFFSEIQHQLYTSKTALIDELVQNAQRAGATCIDIEMGDDFIEVRDNGCGIKDPQDILTLSHSGWTGDVKDNQNPFGMGFWSTTLLGGMVEVTSSTWKMTIDVPKMLKEKTLDVISILDHIPFKGTAVKVYGEVPYTEFRNHLSVLARYLNIDVNLNGKPVDSYNDIMSADNRISKWVKTVSLPGISGHISLEKYASDDSMAYYQGRPVCKLGIDYLGGDLEFSPERLDPRAPDRKQIIDNEKWRNSKKMVENEMKTLLLDVVRNGTDEDVSSFEYAIAYRVGIDELQEAVKFEIRSGSSVSSLIELTDSIPENNSSESFINALLDKSDALAEPSNPPETGSVEAPTEPNLDDIESAGPVFSKPGTSTFEFLPSSKGVSGMEAGIVFWVSSSDLKGYRDSIESAHYYGLSVCVVKNFVQKKVALSLDNFIHVSELSNMVSLVSSYKNRTPKTKTDKRIDFILNSIVQPYGVTRVEVCDITSSTVVEDLGIEIPMNVNAIAEINNEDNGLDKGSFIRIQRSYVKSICKECNFRVNGPFDEEIYRATDVRLLLNLAGTLAHELAHLVDQTEDSTIEHERATNHWYDVLIRDLSKSI